ncbi:MAG: GAF domain-containing protein [Nitrospirota bacterium]|nr:GAF domain-containing protein [Nitrospirota bacterium]
MKAKRKKTSSSKASSKKSAKRTGARTSVDRCSVDVLRAQAQALKELLSLHKAKQAFLSGQPAADMNRLLSDYLNVILSLTGTTAGTIFLREENELVFRAVRGPRARALINRRLSLSEGIAGWVARNGKTCVSRDVAKDVRWSSRISAELKVPTVNILAAPLRIADGVIGVIEVLNKKNGLPFDKTDRELLETLSGQLALDVAYVQSLIRTRRDAERKAMQAQFSMVLNSTLDQREVRKRAMEAATNLMDAEVGSLLLVDEQSNELFFEVALGDKGDQLKQVRLKMGEGIAGWVAANDQAAIVNDVANDPRHFKKAQNIIQFVTRNMICVPVRVRGRVLGVLEAINKRDNSLFTEQDLEAFWMLANQVAVALENANLYAELQETFVNTAEALAAAVEKKDPYTGGHIMRVVEYSLAIAKHLAVPLPDMDQLRLAAVLHDIGKIGVKDSVLLKQGKLTPEEFAHMREHPVVGDDIIAHINQMHKVRRAMRAHHEKWDGSGYPDGLRGDQIPLHARIILVADTLDAITTDRPYRKAADLQTAQEEIKRFMGKEFDPRVAEAFFRACEKGDITISK